jgi:hypothetical protein
VAKAVGSHLGEGKQPPVHVSRRKGEGGDRRISDAWEAAVVELYVTQLEGTLSKAEAGSVTRYIRHRVSDNPRGAFELGCRSTGLFLFHLVDSAVPTLLVRAVILLYIPVPASIRAELPFVCRHLSG